MRLDGGRVVLYSGEQYSPEFPELVEGAWPSGPGEAALQADAAARLGLVPGAEMPVGDRTVTVSALWRAKDPAAPLWLGDPLVTAGTDGSGSGSLVVDRSVVEATSSPFIRWVALPEVASSTPQQLRGLAERAGSAAQAAEVADLTGRGLLVTGDLGPTAEQAARQSASGDAFGFVPVSVLVLIALVAGEVVAIIGASGSGKSTLLNILSGLDRPTGGRARVAGEDLGTMNARQRTLFRRHAVGFVFQQTSRNLLPYLTARENVALPMVISRRRDRDQRALELLRLLGVEEVADRLPAAMSGGQQQRVAIATALANAPSVLLADEPTGELDEASSAEVLEAMRAAAELLGTTVLIVTHDPSVSDHVARTIAIRDGRTSTEVLRRTVTDAAGTREVAEEYTVIDRNRRIQLPAAHVSALGLHERVRLELEPDHVGIWADAHDTGDVAPARHAIPKEHP